MEIDDATHADRIDRDAHRTAFLIAEGYRVIRFWNNEVMTNIDGVVRVIADALADKKKGTAHG
ncbi:MAG: endonuclease protein [Sphingomonas bacterium]|nr:endonuclease protein [Sphingomonas bacterium]